MKKVRTTIEIDAPVERVWEVLTDFASYPDWNPLIISIHAELKPATDVNFKIMLGGQKLAIQAQMKAITTLEDFRWRGPRSSFQGLFFNGVHYFSLEKLSEDRTRFIHGEDFNGLALPLLWWKLEPQVLAGYGAMNKAVKKRSEAEP